MVEITEIRRSSNGPLHKYWVELHTVVLLSMIKFAFWLERNGPDGGEAMRLVLLSSFRHTRTAGWDPVQLALLHIQSLYQSQPSYGSSSLGLSRWHWPYAAPFACLLLAFYVIQAWTRYVDRGVGGLMDSA